MLVFTHSGNSVTVPPVMGTCDGAGKLCYFVQRIVLAVGIDTFLISIAPLSFPYYRRASLSSRKQIFTRFLVSFD